jgi:ubiquinol-cytochrome c reductase cytochrome c1 subunit
LRSYYRDPSRPTGWNNLVFPNVGMPNVLWQLQGNRVAEFETVKDHHDESKEETHFVGFKQTKAGTLNQVQYDQAVADITNYLVYMAEPAKETRFRLGVIVLLFFGVFTLFAWRLNASFWKDIK